MPALDISHDVARRHARPPTAAHRPPSPDVHPAVRTEVLPPSTATPAAARAGEMVAAPAVKPDVAARAQMSVALQQNVGNARMAAMVAPAANAPPQSAPAAQKERKPPPASARKEKSHSGASGAKAGPEKGKPAPAATRKQALKPAAATHGHKSGHPESEAESTVREAGGKAAGGRSVPIKMPEPPADLSPAAKARVAGAQSAASHAAAAHAALPPAAEHLDDAREAVAEPTAEANARAAADLVTALGQRPAPSPQIEELCQHIRDVIRKKRPPDQDSLVQADPEAMAKAAGSEMDASVQGEVKKVDQSYGALDQQPSGTPEQHGQPIAPPPGVAATPPINAAAAAPDAVPPKNVSLDADVADSKARMDQAGMNSEPAKLAKSGPIAEAHDAQGELEKTAAEDPAKVLAEQNSALLKAGGDMAALQKNALAALTKSRMSTVAGASGQKQQMVGSEESMRTKASADAQAIFDKAQKDVDAQLKPLPQIAKAKWDQGVKLASVEFKQQLKSVEDWIKKRHGGTFGGVVEWWDDKVGLPGWVTDTYDQAETKFGNDICSLARGISSEVNGIILVCEAIIANARKQMDNVFAALPANLRVWAETEKGKFGEKLDGLAKHAHEVRDNFNKELIKSASEAVQDVREQIHALREKAKGLLGRLADAFRRFLANPAKFILEALLELVGIPVAAFWAVVAKIQKVIKDIADDPMKFANNLMDAVGRGFSQFFDRIPQHLLRGFIDWLTAGLGSAGVELPKDASLKSILTFMLQLMGITWPRIRKLLAKHLGEKNIALIEKVYSLISTLIELGPQGVFELIKEKLNPKNILDTIINAAVDYMIKAVVKAVSARILLLFNPVGAIFQALEAIYRVLKWIFTNAARIFRLVETIVNGVADILAGNIGAMANAVEKALAGLIAPVIDFLADYLGFGDLPRTIADTIKGFQAMVMEALESALVWLIEKGKALLAAVGLGGKNKDKKAGSADISEKVPFTAGKESHSLWVDVKGTSAVVMVASDVPMTISERLNKWQVEAAKLPQKEDQAKATTLIGNARPLEQKTDKTAEDIVQKSQQASNDEKTPPPSGKAGELSQEEQELAEILKQLFELFGEGAKPSERWKKEIADINKFARAWIISEIDTNESEIRLLKDWKAVLKWLQLRPGVTAGAGMYEDVGGHHIHAKAAFSNHVHYDPDFAFAISQEYLAAYDWDHQAMTNTQRILFKEISEGKYPNTMVEHTRIAIEALKAGGASSDEAKRLVEESLRNLIMQRVLEPSRIPGTRKK